MTDQDDLVSGSDLGELRLDRSCVFRQARFDVLAGEIGCHGAVAPMLEFGDEISPAPAAVHLTVYEYKGRQGTTSRGARPPGQRFWNIWSGGLHSQQPRSGQTGYGAG